LLKRLVNARARSRVPSPQISATASSALDAVVRAERIEAIARDLRTKFDALLSALSSTEGAV
jgi:hypothetical protein